MMCKASTHHAIQWSVLGRAQASERLGDHNCFDSRDFYAVNAAKTIHCLCSRCGMGLS